MDTINGLEWSGLNTQTSLRYHTLLDPHPWTEAFEIARQGDEYVIKGYTEEIHSGQSSLFTRTMAVCDGWLCITSSTQLTPVGGEDVRLNVTYCPPLPKLPMQLTGPQDVRFQIKKDLGTSKVQLLEYDVRVRPLTFAGQAYLGIWSRSREMGNVLEMLEVYQPPYGCVGRRTVYSPMPQELLQHQEIYTLLENGPLDLKGLQDVISRIKD